MSHNIVSLPDVYNLEAVTTDLSSHLLLPSNADVAEEFPGTVERCTSPRAAQHLTEASRLCAPGVREQFIVFSGRHAVGMSYVARVPEVPEAIDPSWPNISGFICSPHRRRGLGKLSIQRRIEAIEANFGGKAWTTVNKENIPSQRLVIGAGFRFIRETNFGGPKYLYTYDVSELGELAE